MLKLDISKNTSVIEEKFTTCWLTVRVGKIINGWNLLIAKRASSKRGKYYQ